MSDKTLKLQVLGVTSAIDSIFFKIEKIVLMVLVIAMTASAFIEVILRYVFSSTLLVGISELINWAFVWIVFIGIASVYKMGNHIGITFFAEKIPVKLNRFVQIALNLIFLVLIIQVISIGFKFSIQQKAILTTAANIPKTYLYISIPIGFICLGVHVVIATVKRICNLEPKTEAGV